MSSTVNGERKTSLPTGFTSNNTFVVAVRISRNGGQYVYTDVVGGSFCAIYLNSDNTVSLVATADGVTYCAGQAVSVILAKV
jgi:hypothetical protein